MTTCREQTGAKLEGKSERSLIPTCLSAASIRRRRGYSGDDLEESLCDDTVAFAQFCVDRDRETGVRDRPPSEEELRDNKELDSVTLEYVDSPLKEYRVVVDVARWP